MYPIISTVGPFTLRSYGLMVSLSFLVAWWLARKEAKRKGYELREIDTFTLVVIAVGLLGTRLYYVLFKLSYYLENPYQLESIGLWASLVAAPPSQIRGRTIPHVSPSLLAG